MIAFCADEKEVLVAFLNLGYDMKRPEVVTLFGGRGGSALAIAWSTAIGRGPDPSQIGLDRDPTASEHAFRSRGPLLNYRQLGASFH